MSMSESIGPECFCQECLRQIRAADKDPHYAEAQRDHKHQIFLEFHRRMTKLVREHGNYPMQLGQHDVASLR